MTHSSIEDTPILKCIPTAKLMLITGVGANTFVWLDKFEILSGFIEQYLSLKPISELQKPLK